jgi:hypothetical protein
MTAQELINQSLRLIGELRTGRSASTLEYADALAALNQLLAAWSAENVPVFQVVKDVHALTGVISYTMGPSATINTARPTRIKSAAVVASSVSAPLELVTALQWTSLVDRSRAGKFAKSLYCDYGFPAVTVSLWPTPASGGSLELFSFKPLPSFAAISDTVALPPGYEQALAYNLAVSLFPEYIGARMDATVPAIAASSKAALSALNDHVHGITPGQVAA